MRNIDANLYFKFLFVLYDSSINFIFSLKPTTLNSYEYNTCKHLIGFQLSDRFL